ATTYFSWRWVFAGEVVIVAVILLLARRIADAPAEKRPRLDFVGAALSALGLALLVFGVLRSGQWGWIKPKSGAPSWAGPSPTVSPRLVVRAGLFLLLAGTVVLLAALDRDAGAEIVTVPLLLIGLGIGSLASQLGAVTVSAVPDDDAPEVGGVQNTMTNLGASLGTALAGAILISTLTTAFINNIEDSPAIPSEVKSQAQVKLSGGVPF